jgi:single-strand DNA-binding protein
MAELKLPQINRVIISGRLTRDPELRYTPSGTAVINMGLASSRRFKDSSGEWSEATTFLDVVAFGELAERCGEFLHKGSAVLVEGSLQSRSWESESGQKRSKVELRSFRVQFLDKLSAGVPADAPKETKTEETDEELPF